MVMVMVLCGQFLNLGFYHNGLFCFIKHKYIISVEYRHKYHNRQHISIRKNPWFIANMAASPAETPSVTSRLRVSVQPAKPALHIRFLYEQLPKGLCIFCT